MTWFNKSPSYNNGLKEVPWAGTGPVRGLAEIRLVSLCPAQGPLEAGGGDVNGEELGQKGGGVLHEEAKLTKGLKDTEKETTSSRPT